MKQLGGVVSHLIGFFHLDTADTRDRTHNDLDDRLRNIIKQLKYEDEAERIQIKGICSVGVQLFMSLTGVEFIPESADDANFKDFDDLESYLFNIIKHMKEKATITGR